MRTKRIRAALLAALTIRLTAGLAGHEIPGDVTVQAFLKPEGQRLRLLVRVPLAAMRDISYPSRGADYLDIERADQSLRDAATLWLTDQIQMYEGDTRLGSPRIAAALVSLPSDPSFASYDQALAHVTGPRLPNDVDLVWNQGMLDVLFEYPIQSDRARFSIHPQLERLGIRTRIALRFLLPAGVERPFEFHGNPGLVRLDPRWHQAAFRFIEMGFFHILDGIDHLLFLFCLVIPVRRLRGLVLVVTSFTVAHSITLIASAFDFAPSALWFPPLIEVLIALSIVYMALENIVAASFEWRGALITAPGFAPWVERRWLIAFGFGLVHGFGFSFALRETLQFAGSHLLTSLFSFNIGVELGQLLVLVLVVPALDVLFRRVVAERIGTIILSALVAHTSWHWLTERADLLRQFRVEWPTIDAAFLASAMRWLMLLVIAAGLVWLVGLFRRPQRRFTTEPTETTEKN
ncbi:MAG: HupE/UreJ family protein [Acidobacteria bacterium]|nr:HupE/UreJ family protein [Acidobacteriota bacterium]